MTQPFAFTTFFVWLAVCLIALFLSAEKMNAWQNYDAPDTAWMLTSSAFVLLMTPGLAFLWGNVRQITQNHIHTFFFALFLFLTLSSSSLSKSQNENENESDSQKVRTRMRTRAVIKF